LFARAHRRARACLPPLRRRFFLTYLFYDVGHVAAVYPRLGGVATLFHHAAFALCSVVAGVTRAFGFAFGWCGARVRAHARRSVRRSVHAHEAAGAARARAWRARDGQPRRRRRRHCRAPAAAAAC
jgi:hypothetical protein